MRSYISVIERPSEKIKTAIGTEISRCETIAGGSLSTVFRVKTAEGQHLVAKFAADVRREARMLTAIAETGCPVPEILYVADDLLIMTDLTAGSYGNAGWADAGTAIRTLHQCEGPSYGWCEPSAFGLAPCPADPMSSWPSFWAERRLLAWPEVLPGDIGHRIEALASRVGNFLPERPRPSLLHGDLWIGNLVFKGSRFGGLIDPACYFGHAEVDLAMLTLFGQPDEAFWEHYGCMDHGYKDRRALYQLWPALVHLRLFGSGYRGMVERCLAPFGV